MTTVVWLLLVELLWLAAFPAVFLVLNRLPDRGFCLSPAIGLLVTAYLVWLSANFGLSFTNISSWAITLLFFAGLNGGLFWRKKYQLGRLLLAFAKARWPLLLTGQAIFLLFFLAFRSFRFFLPGIIYSEQPADFAILNSLLQSKTLPPDDPYLAGYQLNYYYFGHFLAAFLTRLGNFKPSIVVNLFLCTIFGLTASGMVGLGFSLYKGRRLLGRGLAVGLLATFLVCVAGNVDGARQLAAPNARDLELCRKPYTGQCFWFTPGRVIYDIRLEKDKQGREKKIYFETANEFPFFSFMLGDMHAHLITYPYVVLGLALALNFWRMSRSRLFRVRSGFLASYGLGALLLGLMLAMNSWYYPLIFLMIFLALLYREWQGRRTRFGWLGLYGVGLIPLSLGLVLPFLQNFHSFSGFDATIPPALDNPLLYQVGRNIGLLYLNHTSVKEHFLIFGLFEYCIASFWLFKLWPHFKEAHSRGRGFLNWLVVGSWLGLIVIGYVLKVHLLGLMLVAIVISVLLVVFQRKQNRYVAGDSFSMAMVGLCAAVTLALEFFYLRENEFENRFNSLFKFYIQTWIILSLVAAYAIVRLAQEAARIKPFLRVGWTVGLATLLFAVSLYPVIAVQVRAGLFEEKQWFDGEVWLKQAYPANYKAISWLREQIKVDASFRGSILELPGSEFVEGPQVSTFTGLPALIGWTGHQYAWRKYDQKLEDEVYLRDDYAQNKLYQSENAAETEQYLRKHKIKYVFVGQLEQALKGKGATDSSLNKFAKFMRLIYDKEGVQIYSFS